MWQAMRKEFLDRSDDRPARAPSAARAARRALLLPGLCAALALGGCGGEEGEVAGAEGFGALATDEELGKEAFESGLEHAKNGLFDRAIEEFHRAVNFDQENLSYRLALADTFLQLGYLVPARQTLEQALQIDPESPENAVVCAKIGVLEVQQKRIAEGVEYLRRSLSFDDTIAEVHFRLGQALAYLSDIKLGSHAIDNTKLDEAIAELDRAIELDPSKAEYRYWSARVLEQRRDPDQAMARYREALERDPSHVQARLRLAGMHIERGELEEGRALLAEAAELAPNDPAVHFQQGLIAEQSEDLEGAKQAYQRSIDLAPSTPDAHFRLANVLTRLGEDEASLEAMAEFEQWSDLANQYQYWLAESKAKPEDPEVLASLGEVLYLMLKQEEAIPWLRRAFELDNEHPIANTYLGLIMQRMGQAPRAKLHLEKAIAAGIEDPQLRRSLAACLMELEDHEGARVVLTQLLELDPEAEGVHYNLGVVALKLGDHEGARASFERALELDPGDIQARFALASALFEKEAWDEAAREFRTILEQDPEHEDAKEYLAAALKHEGNG